MLRNALLFTFLGLFAGSPLEAKPDVQGVVRDLGLHVPLEVEAQGSLDRYPSDTLEFLYSMVNTALKEVGTVVPNDTATLYSADPTRRLFRNRTFRLILTNADEVKIGQQKVPLGDQSAGTFVGFSQDPDGPLKQTLTLCLRVDQLMLTEKRIFQTYAYHQVFAALVSELLGTWPEHLRLDLPELYENLRDDADGFAAKVAVRSWREYQRLLIHPALVSADFKGPLFAGFLNASENVFQRTQALLGPYVITHGQIWSPESIRRTKGDNGEAHNTWMRAQHLVYSVRPSDLPRSIYSLENADHPALKRKALFLYLVDTREKGRQNLGLPKLLATELLPFGPSETFIGQLSAAGLDQVFSVVLWTDRIFYTPDGRTNPDALALATVALASEMYQGVQHHLYEPIAPLKPTTDQELTRLRIEALQRAVGFVDGLRRSRQWKTLSEEEQKSFERVQATYRQQVKETECVLAVLRRAGSK